jgi:hypothetical protein
LASGQLQNRLEIGEWCIKTKFCDN